MTHEYRSPKYWKEMNKLRAQALKQATSSQATGHKPSSPEPGAQARGPRGSVPEPGIQGTSESAQASGHKQQE